ncbi:hypothetical protein GQ55_9G113800 [Panicum hallii var. hallii]|uniref:Mono-/di-acylglycerol lipase N-terminal domain-containing protein n=1 Tax=Panicum hallii var. hallii TaxID=1504633 RepID=A0A2T7C206_9POAL|nr:hypothetical protein GQ55_9G113800 [Panicum hallii var. hallii]
MAFSCAAECALSLACARWAARRLSLSGADDSASWPAASPASFAPVPRACRAVLAAYDDDGAGDVPPPSPLCPPYRLHHVRARGEVVLAVRGLGLARPEDYRLLLDAGGPAHRGLLRAAVWLLDREGPALRRMVAEAGPGRCRVVFVGHSLGAGDDFLPRTPAPLQHIFGSIFCLPCLLCFVCMRDTFVSEGKIKDPAKLYAPGTVFHIVERKNCRCGRFPPELMEQEEESTSPPKQQKMLRAQEVQSVDVEEGTIGLHSIEHLVPLEEETLQGNSSSSSLDFDDPRTSTTSCSASSSPRSYLSGMSLWGLSWVVMNMAMI